MERFTSGDGSLALRSARYGEGYRSHHGARSESWHVFVAGSGVALRLAAGIPTRLLEVGLGGARNLGASAAVALAHDTPLDYVALEHDLLAAEAWASLESDALGPRRFRDALLALRARTDPSDGDRLRLDVGPVTLEVRVGDARGTPWPTGLDAIYLDAFSPAANPELWSEAVLTRLAAHLAPGGTLVTYSVRGEVRRRLVAAGLHVEKRAGPPGGKRERLWARRPGVDARAVRALAGSDDLAPRRVAVVGAGVAGSSLALAAAAAGARVDVFSADDGLGGASGVPAALVNPYRGRSGRASDDDLAGARRTWAWAAALDAEGLDAGAHPSTVVRVADQARQARVWGERPGVTAFGATLEPPPGRWRAPHGGILVPVGGWIDPPRWLAALRTAAERRGARWHPGRNVLELRRDAAGTWLRLRRDGRATTRFDEHGPFDAVALCLGAVGPGALPHPRVTPVPGTVALVEGHLPGAPLAGAVYAAPVGSPRRYGLDPARPWLAIGGGHGDAASDPAGLIGALTHTHPGPLAGVAAAWHGVRARGPDTNPQVAEVAPDVWWFGSFAGRGFLRAALEAERLTARWAQPGA